LESTGLPELKNTEPHAGLEKHEAGQSILRAWRWWIVPALLSLILALLYLDPFIGDWDALDYTVLSVRGRPSSMALGRSAFIFMNHALWRMAHALFKIQAVDAYLIFKGTVVLMSVLGVIACWALALEVTNSRKASTIAALLVALSPSYIVYSGQVMTEIPSLLLLSIALLLYLRGVKKRSLLLMLAGAGLLGVDVNMRETVGFYAPWLVLAPLACGWGVGKREVAGVALSLLVFLLFSLGPFALWFWTDAGDFRLSWYSWLATGKEEAARHPVRLVNAVPFLLFFFLTSPFVALTLPFAFLKEWREHKASPLLMLAVAGVFSTLLLFLNYSTTVNWRYFLTGLPALAPLVACFFLSKANARQGIGSRAFAFVILCLALSLPFTLYSLRSLRRGFVDKHAMMKTYRDRLMLLPRDSVVMAGGQTVGVTYWRGVGAGEWDAIGTGAGWPGRAGLVPQIESYLKQGRRVFLDTDPNLWAPCGWQREETESLAQLETRFRFRRVSDTIFEIRPVEDATAVDAPHLQMLLPENRRAEVEKCAATGKLSS
jgi:hypothetical protein